METPEPETYRHIEALSDASPDVRFAAAQRLGELCAPEAVGPLIDLLKREVPRLYEDDDDRVWLVALDTLQAIGTPSVLPLIKLVDDAENDQELRHEAIDVLVNIGDTRALPALLNALRDADPLIRSVAASALGTFGTQQAVEPLLQVLNDEDEDVRYSAVVALGELGDKRAVEPLIDALKDNTDVRRAAAEALGKLGDERAIPALLLSQQRETERLHANRDAKKSAADAVRQIQDREQSATAKPLSWQLPLSGDDIRYGNAVMPFIGVLKDLSDNDLAARCTAARVLGQLGDWRATEPLLEALKSEDADLRYYAAEALGNLRDASAKFALVWMKHKDMAITSTGQRVCDAAAVALEAIKAEEDFDDPTE